MVDPGGDSEESFSLISSIGGVEVKEKMAKIW